MTTAAPITTETILQEDGATAALANFAAEVRESEAAIRSYVADAGPGAEWTFRGLLEDVGGDRRKTAMGVALMSLDKAGVLQVDYARSTVAPPS